MDKKLKEERIKQIKSRFENKANEIEVYEEDIVQIILSSYGFGDDAVTFDDLEFLSQLYQTKSINLGRLDYSPGFCDTCDAGSSTTINIFIKDLWSGI